MIAKAFVNFFKITKKLIIKNKQNIYLSKSKWFCIRFIYFFLFFNSCIL